MTIGQTIHLPFRTRVRFPDLATRPGVIRAIGGGWVTVEFDGVAGTVTLPAQDVGA